MRCRHLECCSIAVGLSFLLSTVAVCIAQEPPRPNIVFIYTDDQAPTAVGFAGNDQLQTPHLDRLAQDGAVLRNAFVTTPVCSPSRASLATSRYASELGILDWINPKQEPELGLPTDIVTWMELLQRAGYRTGLFGKWHLGTADRFHPTRRGYDRFVGFRDGGRPPRDAVLEIDGVDVQTEGFIVDVVTDHALAFLAAETDRPFLLSLHYREPHAAWLPTRPEDWEPYRNLDVTLPDPDVPHLDIDRVQRMTREYYASVASVDRNVGRVLQTLDELRLAEQTIVIFTSDHGYHTGHQGLWYKGNAQWQTTVLPPQKWDNIPPKQRPNLFDQALRVPTVVRWPNVIPAGRVVDETVSNLDWFPTILAMARVNLPASTTIRGHNALPLLVGQPIDWSGDLYAEYSMRHGATTDMRAVRTPEWKLMIDFANAGRRELYDLQSDPRERQNLAGSNDPEIQSIERTLEDRLRAHMEAVKDFAARR